MADGPAAVMPTLATSIVLCVGRIFSGCQGRETTGDQRKAGVYASGLSACGRRKSDHSTAVVPSPLPLVSPFVAAARHRGARRSAPLHLLRAERNMLIAASKNLDYYIFGFLGRDGSLHCNLRSLCHPRPLDNKYPLERRSFLRSLDPGELLHSNQLLRGHCHRCWSKQSRGCGRLLRTWG